MAIVNYKPGQTHYPSEMIRDMQRMRERLGITTGHTPVPKPIYPPREDDPLLNCSFVVECEGGVTAAFSQFSGIKVQVQTLANRYGDENRGVQDFIPVMTRYEPITLSKGVIGELDFLEWIEQSTAGYNDGPGGSNLRRTLHITAVDITGAKRITWELKNAFPIGYELAPMDALRSEVLTESITFQITGVRRTIIPPPAKEKK